MNGAITNKTLVAAMICASLAAGCGAKGSRGADGVDGPQGPGPVIVEPAISAVSPQIASPNMIVTITGTNFGSVAGDVDVYFGGYPATVLTVSPTTLTVQPPAGTYPDLNDLTELLVEVKGLRSNAWAFDLRQSGDVVQHPGVGVLGVNDAIRLADGSVLIADNNGNFEKVAVDGTTSLVTTYGDSYISNPIRFAKKPDGKILVLDSDQNLIWNFDPATGAISILRNADGAIDLTYVGNDLYAVQGNGQIDQVLANGTVTYGWANTGASCSGIQGMAAQGTLLFVASSTTLCSVDTATVSGPVVTVVALTGDAVNSLNSLRVDGADLLAAGTFNGGSSGIATITTGGVVTQIPTLGLPPSGFYRAAVPSGTAGAYYVGGLDLYRTDATATKVLAGPTFFGFALAQGNGNLYFGSLFPALVGGSLPFIAEVHPDGTTRAVATLPENVIPFQLKVKGANLIVVSSDLFGSGDGFIDSFVIATGVQTNLLALSGVPIFTYVESAAGDLYPFTGFNSLDQYTAGTNTPQVPGYITGLSGSAFTGVVQGTKLYVATNSGIDSVDITTGGAAAPVVTTGTSPNGDGFNGIAVDKNGDLLAAGPDTLYKVTSEGFLQPLMSFPFASFDLNIEADGTFTASHFMGNPEIVLP